MKPCVRHIFRCPNCKRETVGPDPAKHHTADGVMCGYCWADIGPGDLVRTEHAPNIPPSINDKPLDNTTERTME
jgi:hypothetical protein